MATNFNLVNLVDLALCSPEVGAVNFNILRVVLLELVNQLGGENIHPQLDDVTAHQIQNFQNYIEGAGTASPMPGVLRYNNTPGYQYSAKTPRAARKSLLKAEAAIAGKPPPPGTPSPGQSPPTTAAPPDDGFYQQQQQQQQRPQQQGQQQKGPQPQGQQQQWQHPQGGQGPQQGQGQQQQWQQPQGQQQQGSQQGPQQQWQQPQGQQQQGSQQGPQQQWQQPQGQQQQGSQQGPQQQWQQPQGQQQQGPQQGPQQQWQQPQGQQQQGPQQGPQQQWQQPQGPQQGPQQQWQQGQGQQQQGPQQQGPQQQYQTGGGQKSGSDGTNVTKAGQGSQPASSRPGGAPTVPNIPGRAGQPQQASYGRPGQGQTQQGGSARAGQQQQGQAVSAPNAMGAKIPPAAPYRELENKLERLERQMETIYALPTNSTILNVNDASDDTGGETQGQGRMSVNDMWQIIQLNNRVAATEAAIQKMASLIEDLAKGLNVVKQAKQAAAAAAAKAAAERRDDGPHSARSPEEEAARHEHDVELIEPFVAQVQEAKDVIHALEKELVNVKKQFKQDLKHLEAATMQAINKPRPIQQQQVAGAGAQDGKGPGQGQVQGQQPGTGAGAPGQKQGPQAQGPSGVQAQTGQGQAAGQQQQQQAQGAGQGQGQDQNQQGGVGGAQGQTAGAGQQQGQQGAHIELPVHNVPAPSRESVAATVDPKTQARVAAAEAAIRKIGNLIEDLAKELKAVKHDKRGSSKGKDGTDNVPGKIDPAVMAKMEPIKNKCEEAKKGIDAVRAEMENMKKEWKDDIDKVQHGQQVMRTSMTPVPAAPHGPRPPRQGKVPGQAPTTSGPLGISDSQGGRASHASGQGQGIEAVQHALGEEDGAAGGTGRKTVHAVKGRNQDSDILHTLKQPLPKTKAAEKSDHEKNRIKLSPSQRELLNDEKMIILLPRDMDDLTEKVKAEGKVPDVFDELEILEKVATLWEAVEILKLNQESIAVRLIKLDALVQKLPMEHLEWLQKIPIENMELMAGVEKSRSKAGASSVQNELQNALLGKKGHGIDAEDVQTIFANLNTLLSDSDEQRDRIEQLYEIIQHLESAVVTKPMLVDALGDKADKGMMNTKVSYDEFGNAVDELGNKIQNLLVEVYQKNEGWKRITDQLIEEMAEKLDKYEIGPLRAYFKSHLGDLESQVAALVKQFNEPDPAGTRKKLLRDYNCISCDRHCNISGVTNTPLLPCLGPSMPGQTNASHRAYDLHNLRNAKKSDPGCDLNAIERTGSHLGRAPSTPKVQSLRDSEVNHLVNRYVGGSHTAISNAERVAALSKRPTTTAPNGSNRSVVPPPPTGSNAGAMQSGSAAEMEEGMEMEGAMEGGEPMLQQTPSKQGGGPRMSTGQPRPQTVVPAGWGGRASMEDVEE